VHTSTSERLDAAFALLSSTVAALHSEGRPIYAAALKPELKRRSSGGFDEKTLNGEFTSFKRFLEAAQARGIVDLTPAPRGPDVLVTPSGSAPGAVDGADTQAVQAEDRPRPAGGRFIRRELWRAFNDWTEGELRVYDTETDEVLRFSPEPVPLEPPEQAAKRALWKENPDRFCEITPIGIDRQREWMHAFADSVTEPMRTAMLLALANEKPFRAFSLAVQVDPATAARWQTERTRLVAEEIERWAQDNNLVVRIFETRPPVARARVSLSPKSTATAGTAEAEVRRKVHAAIDRMPLSALYGLSIPIEYVIDPA
jgi:hypothetical protein